MADPEPGRAGNKGFVHMYAGAGKGKTTSAVGLAVRARGAGLRVLFSQFMKGTESAELAPLLSLGVTVLRRPTSCKFVFRLDPDERVTYAEAQRDLLDETAAACREYDVLVMDEIAVAVATGMITVAAVAKLLDARPEGLEVVMTGRDPPEELTRRADYVSVVECRRHPFMRGVRARKGIEF